MDNTGEIDLLAAFKKLLAENKSQQIRLEEYAEIINSRNNEIEMLQTMLLEANENRSSMDNQLNQLKELQRHINDLQQQSDISNYTAWGRQQQVGEKIAPERHLENLTIAYADLQSQLTNLQSQLQDITNRNLLLQQQTSRIASLESLLANAEKEIEETKQKDNPEL
jgi:predicted  nucleic acid-binding Zn-ribbon protein